MSQGVKLLPAILGIGVAAGFIAWFVATTDMQSALDLYSGLSVRHMILAAVFYGITIIFRALRFQTLLHIGGSARLPYFRLLPVIAVHNMYNRIIPFRAGEASYIILLKKYYNYSVARSLPSLVLARVYDGIIVLALFAVCAPVVLGSGALVNFWLVPVLLAVVAIGMYKLPAILNLTSSMLGRIRKRPGLVARVTGAIARTCDAFVQNSAAMKKPSTVLVVILYSLLIWLSMFAMFFVMMHGFGLLPLQAASFPLIVVGSTMAVAVFVLPVNTPTGPMEIGWTAGFILVGLSQEAAMVSGLGVNFFAHGVAVVMGLAGFIVMYLSCGNTEET